MKTATDNRRNGIQWTPWAQLNDLNFAYDLALLSHTKVQMQEKINAVTKTSALTGLTSTLPRQRSEDQT